MRKSTEISNDIKLSTSPDEGLGMPSHYPFDKKSVPEKAVKLYDFTYEALKIITIAFSEEDSEFFSDFSNIESFGRIFTVFGITVGDYSVSEEKFNKNAIECWVNMITLLFVTIGSMPNCGGIVRDHIHYVDESDFLSISVDTSHVDYKTHVMSLMLSKKSRFVLIDNVVMLTSRVDVS